MHGGELHIPGARGSQRQFVVDHGCSLHHFDQVCAGWLEQDVARPLALDARRTEWHADRRHGCCGAWSMRTRVCQSGVLAQRWRWFEASPRMEWGKLHQALLSALELLEQGPQPLPELRLLCGHRLLLIEQVPCVERGRVEDQYRCLCPSQHGMEQGGDVLMRSGRHLPVLGLQGNPKWPAELPRAPSAPAIHRRAAV